jgi:hypothetical protein
MDRHELHAAPAAVTKNVAVRAEAVSNTVSRRVTQEDALDELRGDVERPVRAVPGHQPPGFRCRSVPSTSPRQAGFGRRRRASRDGQLGGGTH